MAQIKQGSQFPKAQRSSRRGWLLPFGVGTTVVVEKTDSITNNIK